MSFALSQINNQAELARAIKGRSDSEINEILEGQYEQAVLRVATQMEAHFLPEKAAGQSAVIQYDIAAPDGTHSFQVKVHDGQCLILPGASEKPRVTLKLALPNFLKLVTGKLKPMPAFFTGKLKLAGDALFATTMQSWFKI
jgi:putative sterol carrier protein